MRVWIFVNDIVELEACACAAKKKRKKRKREREGEKKKRKNMAIEYARLVHVLGQGSRLGGKDGGLGHRQRLVAGLRNEFLLMQLRWKRREGVGQPQVISTVAREFEREKGKSKSNSKNTFPFMILVALKVMDLRSSATSSCSRSC